MSTTQFVEACLTLAAESGCSTSGGCSPGPEASESESLIGFFQLFRPSGSELEPLFDSLPLGDQVYDRMQQVFEHAGDDRRPTGGRDVYFIVRKPKKLLVEQAEHHATQWVNGLAAIAEAVGATEAAHRLATPPKIRVLEGIPPKHPKLPHERSSLLNVITEDCENLTARIANADPHAELLRPACYFMACDAMLRDYLLWPFYAKQTGLADPLRSYFVLWSHGVKYRIFREDQIDLYLPRHAED